MSECQRPTIATEVYRDEEGLLVDYGRRWEGTSPSDESYSQISHPERFAPLHAVATSLVEWLQDTFDVVVESDPRVVADLLLVPDEVVQAIRVTPRDPASAPLTFVLTPFPGVYLHAGSLNGFHFPACGCDACDDNVVSPLEELEWTVRTVVSGGYTEHLDDWPASWIDYKLEEPGIGLNSGRRAVGELPEERMKLARTVMPAIGQWLPWQEL